MIKKYFGIICLFALVMSACSKDEVLNTPTSTDIVQIAAQIESITDSDSRANIGANGVGTFEENDIISLFYNGSKTDLTLTGGTWTPALNWNEIGESTSFSGFYPQVNSVSFPFTHTALRNQNSGKNFEQADLLYAKTENVRKGEKVQLNFKHLMSSLTVKLKSNILSEEQLSKANIKVKVYNQIPVNSDGSLGHVFDSNHRVHKDSVNIPVITLKNNGNAIYQAIVCPQANLHKWSYGGWLEINVNNKQYVISDPPQGLDEFPQGKNVTLTYSINGIQIDPVWGNKTFWVDGLKNMPDPTSSEWKVWHKDSTTNVELKQLPWDIKYGWYDVNKLDRSTLGDKNLCWAASSSNLIHWWLDRNTEEVSKFINLSQPAKVIPQKFIDRHHSDVFDIYKQSFADNGSYTVEGLKWYFYQQYNNHSNGAVLKPGQDNGGYFKEVFTGNPQLMKLVTTHTMSQLTSALKEAFTKKQAIGFEIIFENLPNGHAMTIWGASFDEYGRVNAVYYTDNDDGEQSVLGTHNGLLAARVGDYEGTDPGFNGRSCLENSQGQTVLPIINLILLDQGKEGWNAYFKNKAQ